MLLRCSSLSVSSEVYGLVLLVSTHKLSMTGDGTDAHREKGVIEAGSVS